MTKTSLLVLSLASFSLNAGTLEIGVESVLVPSRLAGSSVSFDDGSFYVTQGTQSAKIENFNLDKDLRGMTDDKLTSFLKHGYLSLNQNNKGEYTLHGNIRVNGGAWDWLIKSITSTPVTLPPNVIKPVIDVVSVATTAGISVVLGGIKK